MAYPSPKKLERLKKRGYNTKDEGSGTFYCSDCHRASPMRHKSNCPKTGVKKSSIEGEVPRW